MSQALRVCFEDFFWEDYEDSLDYILEPAGVTWEEFKDMKYLRNKPRFRKYETERFKSESGKLDFYFPAVVQLLAARDDNAVPPDLRQGFDLPRNVPTLLIRGALSDVLSMDTLREIEQRNPGLQVVEVPDVGHAPILDEPLAFNAISGFLADLEQVTTG